MFCFSFKSAKYRLVMLIFGGLLILLTVFTVRGTARDVAVGGSVYPRGATQEERLQYLEQFGWIVQEEPVSVQEIFIPAQFGDVYNNYNAIQLSQGFDLLPYAGRSVKKWVYAVTNYPGYAQSEAYVQATLLVCQGIIIGGDICSVELDGFMHGFDYLSSH
ncbi:MAG: DUF4830 domain-containing protein [Ruminococcaceae bacterium]|nr:DUF4830 domain-containing protein [Oscillospiraceae bacterium]